MSIQNSHELIKQMVAEDYINGLLKEPEMRANMEQAEQPSMWGAVSTNAEVLPPEPATEMER